MNFPCVSLVDEVALAGGDVPLADGGVGRARVHVDVVQGGARYVLSVAPDLNKRRISIEPAAKAANSQLALK